MFGTGPFCSALLEPCMPGLHSVPDCQADPKCVAPPDHLRSEPSRCAHAHVNIRLTSHNAIFLHDHQVAAAFAWRSWVLIILMPCQCP